MHGQPYLQVFQQVKTRSSSRSCLCSAIAGQKSRTQILSTASSRWGDKASWLDSMASLRAAQASAHQDDPSPHLFLLCLVPMQQKQQVQINSDEVFKVGADCRCGQWPPDAELALLGNQTRPYRQIFNCSRKDSKDVDGDTLHTAVLLLASYS